MFLFSILYQGIENKCFFCTIRTFFEQICSDVQFISPPEEVGEFLLHLLNSDSDKNTMGILCDPDRGRRGVGKCIGQNA